MNILKNLRIKLSLPNQKRLKLFLLPKKNSTSKLKYGRYSARDYTLGTEGKSSSSF